MSLKNSRSQVPTIFAVSADEVDNQICCRVKCLWWHRFAFVMVPLIALYHPEALICPKLDVFMRHPAIAIDLQ